MNWNVDAYRRRVFEQVQLRGKATDRVLDLGCGDGGDAAWLAERAREVIGIDIVEHSAWGTIARPGLQLRRGDAETLPFPDGAFDVVFLKDVLHHSPRPSTILAEARRVCARGGRVYVIEGNRFNPLFYVHMTLMLGHQHFRRPAFERLVRGTFPQARFRHFEAHVYPFSASVLMRLVGSVETLIGTTPGLQRLASYNAAVAAC